MDKKKLSSLQGFGGKINNFMQVNSYAFSIGILLTFFVLNYRLSTLAAVVEDTLVENTRYIKKNIGHPIFLTASGRFLVANKTEMGYYHERFKNNISSTVSNALVTGLIKLSDNYKIKFEKPIDIINKNIFLSDFTDSFVSDRQVLSEYYKGLYQIMGEWRYPEHMDIVSIQMNTYSIDSVHGEEKNKYRTLRAVVSPTVIIKSWIKELNIWDKRRAVLNIKIRAFINPENASTRNPFGVDYKAIKYVLPVKPTAREASK